MIYVASCLECLAALFHLTAPELKTCIWPFPLISKLKSKQQKESTEDSLKKKFLNNSLKSKKTNKQKNEYQ